MVYNIQAVWNDMHAVSGMLHYFQAMAKKHQSNEYFELLSNRSHLISDGSQSKTTHPRQMLKYAICHQNTDHGTNLVCL